MVDALASGASIRKDVKVQVLSWAPPYAFGFGWLTPREGDLRRGSARRSLGEGGRSRFCHKVFGLDERYSP